MVKGLESNLHHSLYDAASVDLHMTDSTLSLPCSLFISLVISWSFALGCAIAVVLLKHKDQLANVFKRFREWCGFQTEVAPIEKVDCDVCGIVKCNRHLAAPNREPWRGLFIDKELDDAVDSVSWSFGRGLFRNFLNFSKINSFTRKS